MRIRIDSEWVELGRRTWINSNTSVTGNIIACTASLVDMDWEVEDGYPRTFLRVAWPGIDGLGLFVIERILMRSGYSFDCQPTRNPGVLAGVRPRIPLPRGSLEAVAVQLDGERWEAISSLPVLPMSWSFEGEIGIRSLLVDFALCLTPSLPGDAASLVDGWRRETLDDILRKTVGSMTIGEAFIPEETAQHDPDSGSRSLRLIHPQDRFTIAAALYMLAADRSAERSGQDTLVILEFPEIGDFEVLSWVARKLTHARIVVISSREQTAFNE